MGMMQYDDMACIWLSLLITDVTCIQLHRCTDTRCSILWI